MMVQSLLVVLISSMSLSPVMTTMNRTHNMDKNGRLFSLFRF